MIDTKVLLIDRRGAFRELTGLRKILVHGGEYPGDYRDIEFTADSDLFSSPAESICECKAVLIVITTESRKEWIAMTAFLTSSVPQQDGSESYTFHVLDDPSVMQWYA